VIRWQHAIYQLQLVESLHDVLWKMGDDGWEPWHIENRDGWREIYFKRQVKS